MSTAQLFTSEDTAVFMPADLPAFLAGETKGGLVWVDLVGPTDDDVALMRDVFGFHPLAIEDTRNFRQRPKIEAYNGYLFAILNPAALEKGPDVTFHELDVFVGAHYVVTVHAVDLPLLTEARRRIERQPAHPPLSPGYVLYVLIDTVVDSYFPIMDAIEEEIDQLGDDILTNPQERQLNRLFELKRTLLELWRVVWPQREILNNLRDHDLEQIDQNLLQHYFRDVNDHLMWIADMVNTFRDTLTGVMDLYMSAVSNRLNRVVNRLTVFTVVIGMLTVISGFYGMNFEHNWPAFHGSIGVPFVLVLMASLTGGLLYAFRRLGWY